MEEKHIYLAVECRKGEPLHEVVRDVLSSCSTRKVFFRNLETLGVHPMGKDQVVRIRLDLEPDKTPSFVTAVLEESKRRTLTYSIKKGFYMCEGWGSMTVSAMCTASNPAHYKKYVGTKIKAWSRQFSA